mmetsp:Transcript_10581/g.21143  ORF Transcript_10581/g.21143 Transcript_10581/m.21143 type:complete len:216 (-) Transcript_10581:781-1428(-)
MPRLRNLHAVVIISSPWVNVVIFPCTLLILLTTCTVPGLSTICKMDIFDQTHIRLSAIFTPFNIPATLSMQIFILSNEIRHIVVEDVGSHVVVTTSIQLDRCIWGNFIIVIGGKSLHCHRANHTTISFATPSIFSRESLHVISFANDFQVFVKDFLIGLEDNKSSLECSLTTWYNLVIISCEVCLDVFWHALLFIWIFQFNFVPCRFTFVTVMWQ